MAWRVHADPPRWHAKRPRRESAPATAIAPCSATDGRDAWPTCHPWDDSTPVSRLRRLEVNHRGVSSRRKRTPGSYRRFRPRGVSECLCVVSEVIDESSTAVLTGQRTPSSRDEMTARAKLNERGDTALTDQKSGPVADREKPACGQRPRRGLSRPPWIMGEYGRSGTHCCNRGESSVRLTRPMAFLNATAPRLEMPQAR